MPTRLRWMLACTVLLSCRRESDATNPPPDDTTQTGVPDDAVAVVDGVAIPRDAFDEALVKMVSGGPASRDDKGLRQRLLLALVARELVRVELAASGKDDAEITRSAVEVQSTLTRLERYRDPGFTPPPWSARPPLEEVDIARASVLTVQKGAFTVDEAEVTAEYERQKAGWTAEQPWMHVVALTVRYDDGIGADECDDYLAKYRRCTTKFPKSTQPTMLADLERTASEWRREAADPAKQGALAAKCAEVTATTVKETESMACDWTSPVSPNDPGGVAERKKAAKARAKELHGKLASGVGADVIAAELGPEGGGETVVHAGQVGKPVAKALAKLKPGALAKQPVDDGDAFVIVKLIERWPSGTIPMQARRAELEDRARLRKFDAAFAALPQTLAAAHEVELHPSFEPLFDAPK